MHISKRVYFLSIIIASLFSAFLSLFIYFKIIEHNIYEDTFSLCPSNPTYYSIENSVASYYNETEQVMFYFFDTGSVAMHFLASNTLTIKPWYSHYTYEYDDGILTFVNYHVPRFNSKMLIEPVSRKVTKSDTKNMQRFLHLLKYNNL